MRPLIVALSLLMASAPAVAHDFWLQPKSFQTRPGKELPLTVQLGHGGDRQRWAIDAKRVLILAAFGPGGRVDHRGALRSVDGSDGFTSIFAKPGVHVLAMQTNHAVSELPAIRFNDYAEDEGLTPILMARKKMGTSNTAGREIYSRRAKALIQVGPPSAGSGAHATRPIGLKLEIVPEHDPYATARPRDFPVVVFFEGRRLPGATVKLTNLEFDVRPVATAITDGSGRARFRIPPTGEWLLNVVWSKQITNDPRADFDTTFSSLTFGYPSARETR